MMRRDLPPAAQIDSAPLFLKEPAIRLRHVEKEALRFIEIGDYFKALHLRMQGVALAQLCLTDPTAASVESSDVVAEAHLRLCENYHHLGFAEQVCWHSQKAIDYCDPARSGRDSSDVLVSAYHYMAKGLILKGDTDCVLYYLRKALSLNHDLHGEEDASNAPLHVSFSDYYIHLEESLQEERNFRSGLAETVHPEETVAIMGINLSQSNSYDKAVGELQKAWELVDNAQSTTEDLDKPCEVGSLQKYKAFIHTKIAQTLAKQGKFRQAIEHYEKAINHHASATPKNTQALASLNHELNIVHQKLQLNCSHLLPWLEYGILRESCGTRGSFASHNIV